MNISRGLFALSSAILVICLAAPEGAIGQGQQRRQESDVASTKERSNMIPMRDGAGLSTDLYFPEGAREGLSTILIRTPYGKSGGAMVERFVEEGYAVAVQDMRGRFESEGIYKPSTGDRNDGHDTVTWLSEQPWSNQKVATYGCSYLGDVQVVLAATQHPNHVAAMPMASTTGYYAHGRPWVSYDGGAFELAQTAGWFSGSGTKIYYGPPASLWLV